MDRVSPEIPRKIECALQKKLSMLSSEEYTVTGGIEGIVKILNQAGRPSKKQIIKALGDEDHELTEKIRKRSSIFWKAECVVRDFFRYRLVLLRRWRYTDNKEGV